MARFADDCISGLKEVTHDLVGSLGEDTKELQMRIGLHSGSGMFNFRVARWNEMVCQNVLTCWLLLFIFLLS